MLLIDTRNTYETAIGMFDGAVDPMTKNFRDFPNWANELANLREDRRPKNCDVLYGRYPLRESKRADAEYGF